MGCNKKFSFVRGLASILICACCCSRSSYSSKWFLRASRCTGTVYNRTQLPKLTTVSVVFRAETQRDASVSLHASHTRCVTCPLHDPSTEDGIDTVSLPSSTSYGGRVTSSWIGCRVFWGPFAPHLALSYSSISAVSPSQKSSGRKTSFTLGKSQCLLTTSAGFLFPGMWWKRMIPAAMESRVRWYAKALWRLWSLE